MDRSDLPAPAEGMVLTVLLSVEDQDCSRGFYRDVLGAEVGMESDPVILKFDNTWIIVNVGGGPTDCRRGQADGDDGRARLTRTRSVPP